MPMWLNLLGWLRWSGLIRCRMWKFCALSQLRSRHFCGQKSLFHLLLIRKHALKTFSDFRAVKREKKNTTVCLKACRSHTAKSGLCVRWNHTVVLWLSCLQSHLELGARGKVEKEFMAAEIWTQSHCFSPSLFYATQILHWNFTLYCFFLKFLTILSCRLKCKVHLYVTHY